jgi:hypothetical protein
VERVYDKPKDHAIEIVALGNPRWRLVRRRVERVVAAPNAARPGDYLEVEILNQ